MATRGDLKMDTNEKNELVEKTLKTINDGVQNIVDKVKSALTVYYELFNAYPNKKVRHKAMLHPNKRVRERNMKRIQRWMAKEMKKQKDKKGCEPDGN